MELIHSTVAVGMSVVTFLACWEAILSVVCGVKYLIFGICVVSG